MLGEWRPSSSIQKLLDEFKDVKTEKQRTELQLESWEKSQTLPGLWARLGDYVQVLPDVTGPLQINKRLFEEDTCDLCCRARM